MIAGFAAGLVLAAGGLGVLVGRLTAPGGPSELAARPARVGETVLSGAAVRYGNLSLRPTGLTCGLHWVVGTHADQEARGQFCRLGLEATNVDSTFHDLTTARQRLVDAAGHAYGPSDQAMRIERQPDVATVGARDAVALDVWFDVPTTAKIVEARLVGDDDPSGIATTVTTPRTPSGVRVRLP